MIIIRACWLMGFLLLLDAAFNVKAEHGYGWEFLVLSAFAAIFASLIVESIAGDIDD